MKPNHYRFIRQLSTSLSLLFLLVQIDVFPENSFKLIEFWANMKLAVGLPAIVFKVILVVGLGGPEDLRLHELGRHREALLLQHGTRL